jgi:hypothetical protein
VGSFGSQASPQFLIPSPHQFTTKVALQELLPAVLLTDIVKFQVHQVVGAICLVPLAAVIE